MNDKKVCQVETNNGDEPVSNHSDNAHFSSILERRLSRREVLAGGLGLAVTGMFGLPGLVERAEAGKHTSTAGSAVSSRSSASLSPKFNFTAVPVTRSDTATIPYGYKAQVLVPWGTPITGNYPEFNPEGNTGEEQEQQIGSNHDGMHYFPFQDDPNGHGLLCVNHEYIDENIFHPDGLTLINGQRPDDEVRKEVAAHGVSITEIRKEPISGQWEVVRGSYNRRVTAGTSVEIRGPVRGSNLVKTKYSPDGTATRGTLNNCAHGYTPWGTYLTCEENWAGYFVNRTGLPREHSRYGVNQSNSRYRWEAAQGEADEYIRFDASAKGDSAVEDYRNEPNTYGWVVEIDPFDPNSKPIKRTAMGRFAHEGCWLAPPQYGKPLVFYSGDDSQNEYIYKFVTKARYNNRVRGDILDEGTLYVACFNDNGTGEWLALDIDDRFFRVMAISKGIFFTDQADVLVNTRLAADVVGATKMDRPEWGAVHPQTREVYMTLTNNSSRTATDAPNPRGPNPYGHIIRWKEQGNRPWATKFKWDIFVLGGPEGDGQVLPEQSGAALTQDNIFASPDGLWIDQNGILWIRTDMSGSQQGNGPFGANAMLAANPATGEIKRFLVGPNDQETTGVVSTPDGKSMFVNFQHPGDRSQPNQFTSNWPDSGAVFRHPGESQAVANPTGPRPRSATVVITREDGGVVGL